MFAQIMRWWRNFALVLVLAGGIFFIPHTGRAIAADNYSAPTDTYQETRNPNRVDSTPEELAKSKLDMPQENEAKGESIYEQVVDKVNRERDTSVKGTSNTKTRSEP